MRSESGLCCTTAIILGSWAKIHRRECACICQAYQLVEPRVTHVCRFSTWAVTDTIVWCTTTAKGNHVHWALVCGSCLPWGVQLCRYRPLLSPVSPQFSQEATISQTKNELPDASIQLPQVKALYAEMVRNDCSSSSFPPYCHSREGYQCSYRVREATAAGWVDSRQLWGG